jgi:hypothetical protein
MTNTRRSLSSTLVRSTPALVFVSLACNSVLGIEDAHVDPTLSFGGETSGGMGGTSSQASGGSSGSSGNSGGTAGKSGTGGGGGNAGVTSGGAVSAAGGAGGQGGDDTVTVAGGGAGNGGDTSTGGLGDAGEAGAGGSGPAISLCEQYCNTITQYCVGTALQYKDRDQCLAVCKLFPQGAVGDPDGNTIACRTKYAGKARYAGGTELTAYCRQAGPGGDGRCGTNCDGLCTITMATCTVEDTPPYFFSNDAACHSTCQGLPDIPFVYGDVSVADGNSAQCRLFHVISAAMMDPEEHCEHVMGLTLCEK